MQAKKENTVPAESLGRYIKLVATIKNLEVRGAALPYTSVNGHMFSFLDKGGNLALRLPEEKRNGFLKKYKAGLMEQHGIVLKEYVAVPAPVFSSMRAIKPYFLEGYNYVSALK